jgi:hypothetical protein
MEDLVRPAGGAAAGLGILVDGEDHSAAMIVGAGVLVCVAKVIDVKSSIPEQLR